MAQDDFELEEIERLVKQLDAPPQAPPPPLSPAPGISGASAAAAEQTAPSAGRPFTTARLRMPAPRTEPRRAFPLTLPASFRLPALPSIAMPSVAVPALGGLSGTALSARVFVGLGVLLSAAMPYWPYAHAWSWGLLFYFCAIVLILVTGIWAAKLTWDERLPAAHTVAIGTVLWGLGLLAAEAVPRIGYV